MKIKDFDGKMDVDARITQKFATYGKDGYTDKGIVIKVSSNIGLDETPRTAKDIEHWLGRVIKSQSIKSITVGQIEESEGMVEQTYTIYVN